MVLEQAAGLNVLGQVESEMYPWSFYREEGRVYFFEGAPDDVNLSVDSPDFSTEIDTSHWTAIINCEMPAVICINGPTVVPQLILSGCKVLFWFSTGYDAEYFVLGATEDDFGSVEFTDAFGVSYRVSGIGSQTKLKLEPLRPPIGGKRYEINLSYISNDGMISAMTHDGLSVEAVSEPTLLDVSGPLAVAAKLMNIDEPTPIAVPLAAHRALLEGGSYEAAALEFGLSCVDSTPVYLSGGLEIAFGRYLRDSDMSHKTLPGIKPADLLGFVYPSNNRQPRIAVLRYAQTGVLFKFDGIGSSELRISLCAEEELEALLSAAQS